MNYQDKSMRLKLSLQRASLGSITPNIRAITAKIIENHIELFFYYDGNITEEDKENASIIESEVIADFDPDYLVSTTVERLDYPQQIENKGEVLIFFLKESQS